MTTIYEASDSTMCIRTKKGVVPRVDEYVCLAWNHNELYDKTRDHYLVTKVTHFPQDGVVHVLVKTLPGEVEVPRDRD